MKTSLGHFLRSLIAGTAALSLITTVVAADVPLRQAHAHNDYEHSRPLHDALDAGFASVEADIYLVNGQLLVAHERNQVHPQRTLEALYLEPLKQRVKQNHGSVYPRRAPFWLWIDIKSEAEATYRVLRPLLHRYSHLLTRFTDRQTKVNAVTVILSGNRPLDLVAREKFRYAGIDGRLEDLERPRSVHLMPVISDNWQKHFKWTGTATMPGHERDRLAALIQSAHQRRQKIRFWATADTPAMWEELKAARVDFINTDQLTELSRFLRSPARNRPAR
jgi:hypothetical protein